MPSISPWPKTNMVWRISPFYFCITFYLGWFYSAKLLLTFSGPFHKVPSLLKDILLNWHWTWKEKMWCQKHLLVLPNHSLSWDGTLCSLHLGMRSWDNHVVLREKEIWPQIHLKKSPVSRLMAELTCSLQLLESLGKLCRRGKMLHISRACMMCG